MPSLSKEKKEEMEQLRREFKNAIKIMRFFEDAPDGRFFFVKGPLPPDAKGFITRPFPKIDLIKPQTPR